MLPPKLLNKNYCKCALLFYTYIHNHVHKFKSYTKSTAEVVVYCILDHRIEIRFEFDSQINRMQNSNLVWCAIVFICFWLGRVMVPNKAKHFSWRDQSFICSACCHWFFYMWPVRYQQQVEHGGIIQALCWILSQLKHTVPRSFIVIIISWMLTEEHLLMFFLISLSPY